MEIKVSEFRSNLFNLVRKCKVKKTPITVTHYGEVVGRLVPLSEIDECQSKKEMAITMFRANLTESWEDLGGSLDCIIITGHKKQRAAFLSPRHFSHEVTA